MRPELQSVTIVCNENFYHGSFAALVDSRAPYLNTPEASNTSQEADSMQDRELRTIGVLARSPSGVLGLRMPEYAKRGVGLPEACMGIRCPSRDRGGPVLTSPRTTEDRRLVYYFGVLPVCTSPTVTPTFRHLRVVAGLRGCATRVTRRRARPTVRKYAPGTGFEMLPGGQEPCWYLRT